MNEVLIVKKEIKINSNVSGVWNAIINPEITRKYMHNSEVISDWKTGSGIFWRDADNKKIHVKGIILKIEPEKILQTKDLSIDAGMPDIDENYSRVTYELIPYGYETLLCVTEDKFNGDINRYKDANGFWTGVLKGMKDILEK